ncbi:hypothetical protein GF420_06165, partial [candidate division GN15 bacterium]|nr:hypothetical protein [candidate division GN15 bacterium]
MRWVSISALLKLTVLSLVVAPMLLLAPAADARQVAITSLPFTYSDGDQIPGVVDTLYIQGTKLTSATRGIDLNSVRDLVLNLGSDTLVFGTGGGDEHYGLDINGPVSDRPRNVKIVGGYILHQPSDTTAANCRGVRLNGHEITMEG